MTESINCPLCDKPMTLQKGLGPIEYREVTYTVLMHWYGCAACGETFTTTEADEATLSQIPNSIWSKQHDE